MCDDRDDDTLNAGGDCHYCDDEFADVINGLNVVFDNPADAGRPSPSFNADILPILTKPIDAFEHPRVSTGWAEPV